MAISNKCDICKNFDFLLDFHVVKYSTFGQIQFQNLNLFMPSYQPTQFETMKIMDNSFELLNSKMPVNAMTGIASDPWFIIFVCNEKKNVI